MKVCQVINALDRADAVSLCLLETDRMLRALGHRAEIFYDSAHRSLASCGRPASHLDADAGDVVLFHYAGYSRILGRVARFRGRRGVVFHNVTPAHFFEGMPETYEFCRRAVGQLPELPELFDFGIGVSAWSADTLTSLGFEHVTVHPIAWETSGLADVEPDFTTLERAHDGAATVLLVARVAPHKGLHFAIEALPEIHRTLGRPVRLVLVGKTEGYEPYLRRLRAAMQATAGSGRVVLTGEVSAAALRAQYEAADVLLQLSEHEGFCVPLVEAMAFDVPIVAARAGAVEETLGGAGILLEDRSPGAIARGVAEALGERRPAVLAAQRARREAFSRPAVERSLARVLSWTETVPRCAPLRPPPSCSVVVCTCDRAQVLGRCLDALRDLDHPSFEVVVVEGPSTDDTAALLDRHPDVRRVSNPERNLSISRNLGIAASAGEIVAFIDDDAVPDRGWLRALAEAYDDPTVGAAGGDVFGPDGDHLQFSNGILSRYGRVISCQPYPDDRNDPGARWCNTLMGTNASFRRRALEAVGGFDENYQYYHDEADLCARIVEAGYRVAHVPAAVVWHGFAPGTVRRSRYDVDFTVVVENTIYFGFCANPWRRRPWRLLGPLATVAVHVGWVAKRLLTRAIGPGHAARMIAGWARGVGAGYRKGFTVAPRRNLPSHRRFPAPTFLPYGRRVAPASGEARHVVLLSQQYPPDACGGIGVYTERLARGLVDRGYRVSVVAAGSHAAVDVRDRVEVYRVPSARAPGAIPARLRVTRKNVAHSLGVQQVVSWLVRWRGARLVESPIWDAEGYATSLAGEVPLVLRLNTPMAIAAEMQEWEWTRDLRLASEIEWALLRNASAVIDPSGTIVDRIASRYGVAPGFVPVWEIPFGVPLPPTVRERPPASEVRFLFVGRLERRKGIDTLLAAVPQVLAACPDAFFDVAGEGTPGAAERLVAAVPPEHRARVRFHGFVDDRRRSDLYESCDAFVAPSRYESFGIVYLEAMAHARPCVGCDVGGAARIIRAGETGALVPPGDPVALAEALIALARDPHGRRRMGQAARRCVERDYRVESMVQRTALLYEEVLAAWRASPGPYGVSRGADVADQDASSS